MNSELALALLVLLIGAVAMLYAGVGHGGASGYLALMALFGMSPSVMRPSALVLNIAVSALATVAFARAGHFRWRLLWPFVIASIPFAYLGGTKTLDETAFKVLVAVTLALAAARLFMPQRERPTKPLPIADALACGAAIGLLSGLVGVGGGIFLTPLLILCAWSTPREAAAVSAPFILLNSLAGLGGLMGQGVSFPSWLWWACGSAIVGGWLGARWSSRSASQTGLRMALGVVLLIAAVKFVVV
ncbi:MAG: sulfite exporter TauE/SafE family protein [Planctomycetes bacterium]|nr:sulfite exporter TauE/SafE family protein [Planctomycetota bacterium]